MKEEFEEKYSLDAATIMEKQSIMLFNAREEVCKLHSDLEKSHIAKEKSEKLCEDLSLHIKELKSCFDYALRMFGYVCDKQKLLISPDEITENLGEFPKVFMALKKEVQNING